MEEDLDNVLSGKNIVAANVETTHIIKSGK